MTSEPQSRTLVAGAGPTGLAATLRLSAAGRPVVLAEASDHVGGLAATLAYDDQLFDIGPHGLSLPDGEVRDLISETLGDRLYTRPLVRRMYRDGIFYAQPFSAPDFWARASRSQRWQALTDYLRARARLLLSLDAPERSFEDWASRRYGAYLYDYYIRSYSVKSWGQRLHQLSPLWAQQRLYDPRPAAVLHEFLGRGNKATEQVQQYCDGGIGTLARELARRGEDAGAKILLNSPVSALRRSGRTGRCGWERKPARPGKLFRHRLDRPGGGRGQARRG